MLTYQNIKNNSTRSIDARLYNDEYFDYMLYRGEVVGIDYNVNDNLIADFSELDINDGILYSTVRWSDAINNGVLLEDIGFTGIDNGLIHFEKDKISNIDFLRILTGSTYEIKSGDTRLFLTPITGNTQNFSYPMFLEENSERYISFKGGFYQGFYKLFGFDYQVLPNGPDFEWNMAFVLRPRSDYEIEVDTVNHIHPENKGIFFYMGTRAENKFLNFYKNDSGVTDEMKVESIENDGYLDSTSCDEELGEIISIQNHIVQPPHDYTVDIVERKINENYFPCDYFDESSVQPCNCHPQEKPKKKQKTVYPKDGCECNVHSIPDYDWHVSDLYTYKYDETSVNCCRGGKCKPTDPCEPHPLPKCDCDWDYFIDNYFKEPECAKGKKYMSEEYLAKDVAIDVNEIKDSEGHLFTKKGYYQIETDNKFLMFDRTPLGITVRDWMDGMKVTLTGRNDWGNINYFPIMNRTQTGYTVDDIYKYNEDNSIPYNIYKDIKNNAFALRITDNGAIGYKYGVLDCNADNEQHYTVEEEYSKEGLIKTDEWNNLLVKFVILNPTVIYKKDGTICPDPNKGKRKMKIYFYLNGNLIFISKELNEFNFRELNDVNLKQEAVPYSISLGGGTQGLLESILPDYYHFSEYIFPIEKDFCGTFIGDIKSFKIYNGYVNYSTIKNYLFKNKEIREIK